jgi:hypothetical protein
MKTARRDFVLTGHARKRCRDSSVDPDVVLEALARPHKQNVDKVTGAQAHYVKIDGAEWRVICRGLSVISVYQTVKNPRVARDMARLSRTTKGIRRKAQRTQRR